MKKKTTNGSCTELLYMDLKKALDTVHDARLLHKLRFYGIRSKELERLTDYLFKRRQCVEYDG